MNDAPAWARDQQLDTLHALAAPFAVAHKPLVFGAFGLTKERDIAPALAEKRVIWTGEPPQAVLIFHPLKQNSQHSDFTGRQHSLRAPAYFANAFASLDDHSAIKVLSAFIERAARNVRIYLEIFEEDGIARRAAAALGFRHLISKVAAGSEIKGLYGYGPLMDQMTPAPLPPEEDVALAVLDPGFLTPAEHADILAELRGTAPWQQHYSSYNKRKSWTSFALRGYADDPGFIIKPAEMSQRWKVDHPAEMAARPRWTAAASAFPRTIERLHAIGCEFDRVRFMRLAAKGGELSRHADITDREAGLTDGKIARLHIPITTSNAVVFNGWNARGVQIATNWPQGALCYLDQRKPHAVQNANPTLDRVHLVVDVIADAKLRRMIAAAA
jgi:hypothetical protein